MGKYVLAYRGGSMPEGEAERGKVMQAWETWFGSLGARLVDGGNPFGAARSVGIDGGVTEGAAAPLSGYTIIEADSLDAAVAAAKDCPVRLGGASIDVYETVDVMAAMGEHAH